MFGLALLVFAWLMGRSPAVPARIAQPTFVSGLLLVLIYMGRLPQVIDPAHRLTTPHPALRPDSESGLVPGARLAGSQAGRG